MPLISIITPVLAGKEQYLPELWASLLSQDMPPGWKWEWVVQEDGATGRPLALLPDDQRISPGKAPHGRQAMARTITLSRVRGVLTRAVDADDVLPPGALHRDITVLMQRPGTGWCVSPALDLLPDGTLHAGPRDPDPGPLPPGFVADGERSGILPVVGGTMCTYTQLIRVLGGWPAIPAEDVGLLIAVEAVADGWMHAEPGLHYRRWPGAMSRGATGADKVAASPGSASRTVLLDRADALRTAGWRWDSARAREGVLATPVPG